MLFRKIIPSFVLTLVLCVSASWAQDQQQDQQEDQQQNQQNQQQDNSPQAPIAPIQPTDSNDEGAHQLPAPAGRALFGISSRSADTPIGSDTNSLTGAEAYGLGFPNGTHNLFDLALFMTTGGETGIEPGELNFMLSAGGLAALNHSWNRYQFTGQYSGAETINSPASFYNSGFQDLSAAQTIKWRRTTLRLRDDFVQSAGALFGGLSTGGPGLTMPVGLVTSVAPTFVPSETILTGTADRVNDLALGEVDYQLSRRSILTFAGSYGFLHFLTSGYISSQQEDGRVGYGYQLDRKNALGFLYDYDYISFTSGAGFITSNVVQATYGRLLSGRTALQVSAGPQFITSNAFGIASPNLLSWSALANVSHQVRRTIYSASYSRGVTNGSGVLLGAQTQTVAGSISTVVFRRWTPSVSGGFAYDSSLSTAVAAAGSAQYSGWFGSVNFGRLWDRLVQTNFSYEFERQTQNAASCPVASCGPSTLLQVFSITVNFHLRPVAIE